MHSGGLKSQPGERKWQVQKDLRVKRKQKTGGRNRTEGPANAKNRTKKLSQTCLERRCDLPSCLTWYLKGNISYLKKSKCYVFIEFRQRLNTQNHLPEVTAMTLFALFQHKPTSGCLQGSYSLKFCFRRVVSEVQSDYGETLNSVVSAPNKYSEFE